MLESTSGEGGVWSGGVSAPGGSAPGGCLVWGGVCSWGGLLREGVCSQGGCLLPGDVLPQTRCPPVNRMTDRCKNITLATTSLRPVTTTLLVSLNGAVFSLAALTMGSHDIGGGGG